ncbi:MAG TPA: dihydrolipoamide acetyltransferase family protein [Steroidobacteraceae bacterium]|nr:dihydrolipoamide acetyltransferase family protein [Steroidobacteraceae bacterium]
MTVFKLPDLGEGLSDAEILRWHVQVGDTVSVDQPMLSVETAKAVVEVPAPQSGVITALHGAEGDRIETGAPLVEFASEQTTRQTSQGDSGTVVGHMPSGADEYAVAALPTDDQGAGSAQRIQAVPAARALARSLGVDLATLTGSGRNGLITLDDVITAGLPEGAPAANASTMRPADPPIARDGAMTELRSLRRAMANSMALARDNVMSCSVFDDADLHRWSPRNDYTLRVLRAIGVAAKVEPGLNAWYDGKALSRRLFDHVDVGMAVDTPDGLIVPILRDVGRRDFASLREGLDKLKQAARDRTVPPAELRNWTFMLSNFGMMAGRYATPVVVPPAVAILGTGRVRDDVVAEDGKAVVHRRMPLSLTFDHRCITGGEAVRFLGALISDLELAE